MIDLTRGPRISAARALAEVGDADRRTAAAELRLAAVRAYLGVIEAERILEARDAALALVDREIRDARARWTAGRGLEADVLGLEARRAEIEADRLDAIGLQRRRAASLEQILGRRVTGTVEIDSATAIAAIAVATLADAQDLAMRQRPELSGSASRVSARTAEANAAGRARLPRLVAEADYGTRIPDADFDASEEILSVSVGLEWAPFRGGAIGARSARARAGREAEAAPTSPYVGQ